MRIGRGLTLLLLLQLMAASCVDDDIPVYDIQGLCLHQASLALPDVRIGDRERMIERCYQQQQRAYEVLRSVWPKAPTAIRAKYDAAARSQRFSAGFGDYEFLKDRLLVELQRSRGTWRQDDIDPGK